MKSLMKLNHRDQRDIEEFFQDIPNAVLNPVLACRKYKSGINLSRIKTEQCVIFPHLYIAQSVDWLLFTFSKGVLKVM